MRGAGAAAMAGAVLEQGCGVHAPTHRRPRLQPDPRAGPPEYAAGRGGDQPACHLRASREGADALCPAPPRRGGLLCPPWLAFQDGQKLWPGRLRGVPEFRIPTMVQFLCEEAEGFPKSPSA